MQERIQKKSLQDLMAKKGGAVIHHKPINIPPVGDLIQKIEDRKNEGMPDRSLTAEEKYMGELELFEKRKKELQNDKKLQHRRLVCFSCWTMDGHCCENLHEVDDHPMLRDGGNHRWKAYNGDGLCTQLKNAVTLTRSRLLPLPSQ